MPFLLLFSLLGMYTSFLTQFKVSAHPAGIHCSRWQGIGGGLGSGGRSRGPLWCSMSWVGKVVANEGVGI